MKNSVLMSIMFGMVLVAGMASADANTQKAAAASDDDSFLAYIDPSHSADFDKKMVASNSVVGSGAGGSSTERITLLYDIDPSNRIEVKRGPIVSASSLGKMAPDVLLDEIK